MSVRVVLLFVLTLFCLGACTSPVKNRLSLNDAHKILLGKKNPDDSLSFWDYRKLDSVNTLVGIYTNARNSRIQIYTISAVAGLRALHIDSLPGATRLTKSEWVSLNRRTLLAIDYLAQGQSFGNRKATFNLFDPATGSLFTLGYSYTYKGNNIKGEFDKAELESLHKFPQELAYLQKEAGMSELIPSADKINRRPSADSALKKWAMLNEGVYDALDDKTTKSMHLNVEEYNSDISPRLEDYNNDTLVFRSNTFLAENGDFKVVSQVSGPVYVSNTRTNKSFIIWAPPQNLHWINKLRFSRPGILVLTPAAQDTGQDQVTLQVNISQKTIEKITQSKVAVKKVSVKPRINNKSHSRVLLKTHPRKKTKLKPAAHTHRSKQAKKKLRKHQN